MAYRDACHRNRGMLADLEALDASIRSAPARSLVPPLSV
jgi:hypothetical protein